MKVNAIAWASGTRPMPQKQERHESNVDRARDMDAQRQPVRPAGPPRQVKRGAHEEVGERAPHTDGDDADDEHEMLHHRIHDRQHRHGAQRDEESLHGMLGDAVHPTALRGLIGYVECDNRGRRRRVDQQRWG
jgi:hypothetical protein